MFQLLRNVITDRLREQGIAPSVEAARVVEEFKKIVSEKFGDSASNSFRKIALHNDTIEVSAYSGALASELRMIQVELEERLVKNLDGKHYRLKIFG